MVGQCQAGYYCPDGSVQTTEVVCPDGAYCPIGSAVPTDCPNGTYSNQTGLESASQCTACLEGYYCNGFGLTSVSGPCKEGERVIYAQVSGVSGKKRAGVPARPDPVIIFQD